MSNNNNNMGTEEKPPNVGNMGGGSQRLRRPNPETTAKLENSLPGSQDATKGRPILGAQSSSPQTQNNLMYTNTLQMQSPPPQENRQTTKGSALSVDAAEFVPRQPVAIPTQPVAVSTSNLLPTAAEFVPHYQDYTAYPPPHLTVHGQYEQPISQHEMALLPDQFGQLSVQPTHWASPLTDTGDEPNVIDFINFTIDYLTTNPGEVDNDMFMRSVVAEILEYSPDEAAVTDIAGKIIEQGITEPNFRYTGAKLCQFLSKHLVLPQNQNFFRGAFFRRFQQEYSTKDALIVDPSQHHRICGLTLFLGELFLNIEMATPDRGSTKLELLRQALLDLLMLLLSAPTEMIIKTTCQLLKLTGAAIEDTVDLVRTSQAVSLDQVFLKLHEIHRDPALGQTARVLISSVLSLRDTNWGKDSTTTDVSQASNLAAWEGCGPNGGLFFGAGGQPITPEQAGYQYEEQNQFAEFAFDSGDVAYPHWANDDSVYDSYDYASLAVNAFGKEGGMNDEMEAAYEEFLRSQGHS